MAYRKTIFGTTSEGEQIEIYTLMNSNGYEASFTALGAAWVTMKMPGRYGGKEDVILGFDSPDNYLKDTASMGAVVGRNANRIAGAGFCLNGIEYSLTANDGSNNLHSGMDFYKNRIWHGEAKEIELGITTVFTLSSPDGDQGFPGNAKIQVRYTLAEDNSVVIEYHMVCDDDTIANFTNHCYFNLAGHHTGDILEQKVYINADYFTPADQDSIPTGALTSVKNTPMDFTVLKAIGADINSDYEQLVWGNGYDHNWVLNHYNKEVRLAAKAVDEKSKRALEVYTDLPGLQFYTGNFLDGAIPGKDGAHYGMRAGYCFETQYYPDAIHHKNFPSPVLRAGEEYKSTTVYRFFYE